MEWNKKNAEKAFEIMYKALEDYKKRKNEDDEKIFKKHYVKMENN